MILPPVILPTGVAQAEAAAVVLFPPTFSKQRSLITDGAPFQLTLSTLVAGGTIRYTLDGTTPTNNYGTVYSGPINISATTAVRALVYAGSDTSPVETHTYIYVNTVRNQNNTPLPGWPSTFADNSDTYGPYPADYEMDPDIINHANYTNKIEDMLVSIPTISLVTDLPNLWDPNTGIYYNPNEKNGDPDSRPDPLANEWERPISLEWINPDGTPGFGALGGARMHGQASRRPKNTPKHTFRISFKKKYGAGKLDFALFDFGDPVAKFDQILLRNGGNRSWSYHDRDQRRETDYANDEWSRRTWIQMGHLTARGNYVHLYINGLYWGLYIVTERLDEKMLQAYLGGLETDYDYIVSEEDLGDIPFASAGDMTAYNQLLAELGGTGDLTNEKYQAAAQLMDMENFADYLLHTHYIGKTDWPNHNYNAYRKRTGSDTRFKWMTWDDDSGFNKFNQLWYRPNDFLNYPQSPGWMFVRLITNPEFRQLFADRIYKHVVASDGVLTPANCAAVYTDLTNKIDQAVIGESARWGDYTRDVYARPDAVPNKARPAYLYSRDLAPDDPINFLVQSNPTVTIPLADKKSWVQVRTEKLNTYCPGRSNNLISQYVAPSFTAPLTTTTGIVTTTFNIQLYQTTLLAPTYSQKGGAVAPNYNLQIGNPNGSNVGDIYFTTDGSDPRAFGGGIGATATAGADLASTVITQVTNVKARVFDGVTWSPLMDYMFYPPQQFENLVINEIHYNPSTPVGVDGDDYEFIELYNKGATTLKLDNTSFTRGFSYQFPVGATIAPGQYLVLASDPTTFSTRYPGVTVAGDLRGNISNRGEAVEFRDATGNLLAGTLGTMIDTVDFNDLPPWPATADGVGPSLELTNPTWDNTLAANWKASTVNHGTPGAQNSTFQAGTPSIVILTSPANNAIIATGTSTTIAAQASGGTITQVAFFANGSPIVNCVDTTAPYECNWTPFVAGTYILTAQVTNAELATSVSPAVTVQVNGEFNQLPTVAINNPLEGSITLTGNPVSIAATAADPDGSVTQVAFFANGTAIANCVDTTAPYTCTWTPTVAGAYALTAVATDNYPTPGTTTSAARNVSVSNPNGAPTVAINSPASGITVDALQPLVIAATAADADGTVTQVAFFANGTAITNCVDTTAPYTCSWTPTTGGTFALTAEATDNLAAITTSTAVNVSVNPPPNQAPTVSISNPANGTSTFVGSVVGIVASASDVDGSVASVTFFANGATITGCVDTSAPFGCSWTPTTAGTFVISAQAKDNTGATTDSATINITVNNPVVDPANQRPTASIVSPANNTSFQTGNAVTIQAVATDPDGNVIQVAFFANGTLVSGCVDATAPYECTYTPTAGTHFLTVVATDNKGAVSDSVGGAAPVNITVNDPTKPPPTVSLNVPAASLNVKVGDTVQLQATTTENVAQAASAGSSVVQVIFFANNAPIAGCTDTTAPYQCTWTATTVGAHVLKAQATGDNGAVGTSADVTITVTDGTVTPTDIKVFLPLVRR